MKNGSEHLDKLQYLRNTIENELLWVRRMFFNDVFSNKSLKDVVKEYNMPLIKIWYKEIGKELLDETYYNKADMALWELNNFEGKSKDLEEQNVLFVLSKINCPKEVVTEIIKLMDILYMFSGKREYDSTDPEFISQHCNIYMEDYEHKTNELFNKLILPINEVVEDVKNFKK